MPEQTPQEQKLDQFIAQARGGALVALKRDGRPQLSNVSHTYDPATRLLRVSTTADRAKVANLRRDPAATVLIHSDDWDGPFVQLDGTAEVIDLPDAVEPLVDYFRSISGEHPDWDEYRQAMRDQGKSLIRVTIEHWGPIATGGFPPELAD